MRLAFQLERCRAGRTYEINHLGINVGGRELWGVAARAVKIGATPSLADYPRSLTGALIGRCEPDWHLEAHARFDHPKMTPCPPVFLELEDR